MKSVEETRRRLFEEDCIRNGWIFLTRSNEPNYSHEYENQMYNARWRGFNAALDAIEIKLPEKEYSCEYGFHYYDAGNVIEAVESLNLGIKVT